MALGALAAGAYFSIRLAAADAEFRRHTPEGVGRAIAIEPSNTEYLLLRGLQLDYNGEDPTSLLERAAELNPLSSTPRIRLGLNAEIRGDNAGAEKWLLAAARVDHQYEPQWTLANFYFRRGDAEKFWPAMQSALAISYGDRRPAFELCRRMGDAQTILERAIPDERGVLASYLIYALESQHEAVVAAALRLARFHRDRPVLLAAVDSLIDAEKAADARAVWAAMGFAAPAGVFDGDFRGAPLGRGFDWRESDFVGIVYTQIEQPAPGLRIALDGRQPEACELLTQIVNLEPRANYVLKWEARGSGLGSPTGIEWRIAGKHAAAEKAGEIAFTAAKELETLTLAYQRPNGETRAEGLLEIARVSIEKTAAKAR